MNPNFNTPGNDWSLPQPTSTGGQPEPFPGPNDTGPTQPTQNAPVASPINQQQSVASTVTATTDDTRAFDKEFVQKVRAITRQYSNDPYLQTVELNKLRAAYLQQRFGKKLEVSES